jgi:beta-mannanase
MYRHVVTRLRADGVRNAVFVVDYMGAPKWGEQSWFNDLYPGDDVVDWIAEDPYSIGSGGLWRSDFAGTVDRRDGSSWPGFYTWATTAHPGKPIMLAEWGVTEDPSDPAAKAKFFSSMAAESQQFPDIKAFVYWSAPGAHPASATLVDSDPAALSAFRLLAASPQFQVPGR